MAKGLPANDVGAAAATLRDAARPAAGEAAKVDVMKVLDRIAAALAALDEGRVLPARKAGELQGRVRPITKVEQPAPERARLKHNWG